MRFIQLSRVAAWVWIGFWLLVGGRLHGETVTVFAAASLTDALQEIAGAFEQRTGDRVVFNFAGSGILARQIIAGAPADLFFSADEVKTDWLEKEGLVLPGDRTNILSNSLVVLVPKDSKIPLKQPADLAAPRVKRIALGDPATVPAGGYARAVLEAINLWDSINSKVIPVASVRAVVGAVASGNVDAGITYRTDARVSPKVEIGCELPLTLGVRVRYPLAQLQGAPHPEAAKRFFDYLLSDSAASVFRQRGFEVLAEER